MMDILLFVPETMGTTIAIVRARRDFVNKANKNLKNALRTVC